MEKKKLDKGKLHFLTSTVEFRNKVQRIAEKNFAQNEADFIFDDGDKNLFDAYKNYTSEKESSKICNSYIMAFAEWFNRANIRPAIKGIKHIIKQVDLIFNDISPDEISKNQYLEIVYKVLAEMMYQKNALKKKTIQCTQQTTLYIHKNMIKCQKEDHNIISATAVLTGRNNKEIKLNVNYCTSCDLFFINYESYKLYRNLYGIMIGNLKLDTGDFLSPEKDFLAEASPLNLCGYSVNQGDGYSNRERQYIISKIIDNGIMKKSEIIRYLEHFIKMNGKKKGNEIALEKWASDLEYTLNFNLQNQEQYKIPRISRY